MADDSAHDFAAFVVAASGDLPDEIERFRRRPWQLRLWSSLVKEGNPPKIVMRRGGRGRA